MTLRCADCGRAAKVFFQRADEPWKLCKSCRDVREQLRATLAPLRFELLEELERRFPWYGVRTRSEAR